MLDLIGDPERLARKLLDSLGNPEKLTDGELSRLTSEDALLFENNTLEMHLLRMRQLLPEILSQAITAFVISFFLTCGLRMILEIVFRFFASHETGKPKFLQQSDT